MPNSKYSPPLSQSKQSGTLLMETESIAYGDLSVRAFPNALAVVGS